MNIRREESVNIKNKDLMFKVIKNAFMQRRKTLLNALTNAKMFKSKEEGKEILEKLGLEENIRAEKLSLEKFAELVNLIKEK